jgi:membrane protease YdiL (CAAX protease family)
VPAFPSVREQLAGAGLPGVLIASAVLPYLACCSGAIQFQFVSFVKLVALALALGLWYRVLPAVPVVDVGFLVLIVAVKLGRYGAPIYPTPYKGVELGILGDLALFNMAVLVLMLERRIRETGFGFLPSANDWRIGLRNYLYFLPVGAILAYLLHAGRLVAPSDPLKLSAYFIAFLFGLTLAEEFVFRGVLQQWIEDWTWSRRTALILTSILFGGVHLWFRHFPNWRWVILAGTLGWFCGRARNQAGSIRAAMVTHTLAITTWRAFLA